MKTQHMHHKSLSQVFFNSVATKDFAPIRFRAKALSDDSCWDEFDSDYEESLPINALTCFDDTDFK